MRNSLKLCKWCFENLILRIAFELVAVPQVVSAACMFSMHASMKWVGAKPVLLFQQGRIGSFLWSSCHQLVRNCVSQLSLRCCLPTWGQKLSAVLRQTHKDIDAHECYVLHSNCMELHA